MFDEANDKSVVVTLIATVYLLMLSGCAVNHLYPNNVQGEYPTFYWGEHSWNAMIFKDTTLYGQGFSDAGGMLSDVYYLGNWRFINDSTVECYNLKKRKKTDTGSTLYYLDRIDILTQVLVPDQSLTYYRDSLQIEFHLWIKTNPFHPTEEDLFLIRSDSVKFYPILSKDHRKSLISKYARRFDDLRIYYGEGL